MNREPRPIPPAWTDLIEQFAGFDKSRFLVVGLRDNKPEQLDIHQVTPEAHHYIGASTWRNKQDRDLPYSNVYFGMRLLWSKAHSCYLPVDVVEAERGQ